MSYHKAKCHKWVEDDDNILMVCDITDLFTKEGIHETVLLAQYRAKNSRKYSTHDILLADKFTNAFSI
jgi:hypothetical protein